MPPTPNFSTAACWPGRTACARTTPRIIAQRRADALGVPSAAIIAGGGVVPTPLLAELIRDGAKVRPLRRPDDKPEPQYRPSTKLDEFVRMRDLTCRFPNCDQPAEFCDIDHTAPWPNGQTHPSKLRCW